MKSAFFYILLGLQLFGMALVGMCLVSGLSKDGDYSKADLVQFLGGMAIFYVSSFFRKRLQFN